MARSKILETDQDPYLGWFGGLNRLLSIFERGKRPFSAWEYPGWWDWECGRFFDTFQPEIPIRLIPRKDKGDLGFGIIRLHKPYS